MLAAVLMHVCLRAYSPKHSVSCAVVLTVSMLGHERDLYCPETSNDQTDVSHIT